jgi:hypothetical protein
MYQIKQYIKMKFTLKTTSLFALLAVGATLTFSSCSKKSSPDTEEPTPESGNFAIVGGVNTPSALYLLTPEGLTSGSVSAIGNGAEISSWNRLFKKGYYYKITPGKFSKFKYENKVLTTVTEIPVTGSTSTMYWLNDNTILIGDGTPAAANPILNYTIINTDNMTVTKTGTVGGQVLGGTDKAVSVASVTLRGSKLYIGYTIFDANWTATNTAYLAVVDYPAMNNVVITTDTRSTYPGSIATDLPSTLTYNGDIYILSNVGDRWGINPNKPSGIWKIKNNENTFDANYFFNLSALSNGNREYYGLWDLGNGKAITRMGRADLLTAFEDYTNKDVFEYYVLDLNAKTRTKLDLPLDRGVRVSPVWVENGKAYIGVSSATQGKFIYTYDIASGSLTKGMEVKGVDYISWISRFN